jgi:hypothetical protein
MYMYMLLAGVARMRYSLFSSFLYVPAGVLRQMATRQSVVGLDDGGARDHDDSDNEALPAFAAEEEQQLPKRMLASEMVSRGGTKCALGCCASTAHVQGPPATPPACASVAPCCRLGPAARGQQQGRRGSMRAACHLRGSR